MIVLDTDVLIDLLEGDTRVLAAVERLQERGETLATTAVNVAELARGEEMPTAPAFRAAVTDLLASLRELPLEAAAARRFGAFMHALDRAGRRIPELDGLIAAVAIENEAPILTRNRKHFDRVVGLDVQSP